MQCDFRLNDLRAQTLLPKKVTSPFGTSILKPNLSIVIMVELQLVFVVGNCERESNLGKFS
jgi:hypothetical protein